MAAKDLYLILQVPPTATTIDIKKAYRRLALKYHPDKNPDDSATANHFLEIKKAYEILSNAAKRQKYNYDNYNRQQKQRKKTSFQPVSPQSILNDLKDLAFHINSIDVFRMSHEALYFKITEILSDQNMLVLQYFQDISINKKIIEVTLKILQPLSFKWVKKIEPILIAMAFTDNATMQLIHGFITTKKRIAFWEKYNVLIIAIVTIIICTLIYLGG